MIMRIIFSVSCFFIGLLGYWVIGLFSHAYAVSDPFAVPNNKYGIHVIDENDLENAASLVNSSGGDWGYMTIVIPDNERKIDKWNAVFDRMHRLHLIPIVRIATHLENAVWVKPTEEDVETWARFLTDLKWVTKNRYVIIFNEPNHAKEWGNTISPEEYAEFLLRFSNALKEKSADFFVLPAGLDASAPNSRYTMDESLFIRRMIAANPEAFDAIDGWTSHSYPNPGFSGSVYANGKGTLRTYRWELTYLKQQGIDRQLPVLITETGWMHSGDDGKKSKYFSPEDVAELMTIASEEVWSDPQIIAVTPFLLNYPTYPFSQFSWQKPAEAAFYPQFDSYRSIPKSAGQPEIAYDRITPTPTLTPTGVLPTHNINPGENVLSLAIVAEDRRTLLQKITEFFSQLF